MSTIPNAACIDPAGEHDPSITSGDVMLVPVARKIIQALRPCTPHNPQELGFSAGVFFYVVAEAQNRAGWYEAYHPMSSARGLVPKSHFREFLVSDILDSTHALWASSLSTAAKSAAAEALLERGSASIASNTDPASENPSSAQVIECINSAGGNNPLSTTTTAPPNHLSAEGSQSDRPLRFTLDFVNLQTPIASENFTFGDVSEIIARGELPTMEDWKRVARSSMQSGQSVNLQPPTSNECFTLGDLSEIIARGELPSTEDWTRVRGSMQSGGSESSDGETTGSFYSLERSDSSGETTESSYSTQAEAEESISGGMLERNGAVTLTHVFPPEVQQIISGTTTPTHSRPSTATPDEAGPRTQQSHPEITSPIDMSPPEPRRTDSELTARAHSPPRTPTQTSPSQLQSFSSTSSSSTSRPNPNILPPGLLLSANIIAVERQDEQDWFKIEAVYLPDGESSAARKLVISRLYDHFYDFQLALMDAFPVEAGRERGPHQTVCTRKLPFMPRPDPEEVGVNDTVNEQLHVALDDYLDQLCELVDIHAEHVLRHEIVRSFFTPRTLDNETASRGGMELAAPNNPSRAESAPEGHPGVQPDTEDLIDVIAALSLGPNISRDGDAARHPRQMVRYNTAYWTEILRQEESDLEDLRHLGLLEEERQRAEESRRREADTGHHPYSDSELGLEEPLQIDTDGIESLHHHVASISPSSPGDGLCVVCQDDFASMAVIDCG
ncbi:hypothetical protein BU17DRAFT_63335 [Hysterangium stoloniferum]|nr:hypothetical protein BU17DRAFT_63335 [Hysterangium stoloniferum]